MRYGVLGLLLVSCLQVPVAERPADRRCALLVADQQVDEDGDGFSPCTTREAFFDCDDRDPSVHPWATELCNGVDDDCDGATPGSEGDRDGDGWRSCAGDCDDVLFTLDPADADGDGWSSCQGDCDDEDPALHPAAAETCDGRDEDCDGVIEAFEVDRDGDGQAACEGDCDDDDPLRNRLDLDLDGATTCDADCDDLDPARSGLAVEACNGRDDDCDDHVDEECP